MAADDARVEALFHQALALPPAERAAFLAAACDEATVRRVRQLLQASEDPGWFLDDPLVQSLATLGDGQLPIGTRIIERGAAVADNGASEDREVYEIVEWLGSGGMGHVYRARHLRLQCDHAIKVLRRAGDPKADARLLAEAQRAALLSHPNICSVLHVGEHDGRAYLVMEFVRGDTLQECLRGGPLPLDRARRYAIEIAEALAHAHESGVVHGDLKPANIIVTRQGHVKVLDFGVARLLSGSAAAAADISRTVQPIAGTLPYMPPEALGGEGLLDERGR